MKTQKLKIASIISIIALVLIVFPNHYEREDLSSIENFQKIEEYHISIIEIDTELDGLSKENIKKSIEEQYEINRLLNLRKGLENQINFVQSPYSIIDFKLKVSASGTKSKSQIMLDSELINIALEILSGRYELPNNTKVLIEEQLDIYYVRMSYDWSKDFAMKSSDIATVELEKETKNLIRHYQGRISNIRKE